MVFFIKMNGYQKLCDTNKNVTKMGVIIKGVYCISCDMKALEHNLFSYPFVTPLGFLHL
jgi:hypothetical protein